MFVFFSGTFSQNRSNSDPEGVCSLRRRLVPLAPAEGSLGSGGRGAARSRLHGLVGQDAVGELVLGLAEAGTGPPVLGVDLETQERRAGGCLRSILLFIFFFF